MVYRLPPLSTFRVFEAAARHLSFKKAAEELNVTPSAISQQIKKLESYLGVPLFERLANGLQLTQHGVSMIPKVREGLECFVVGVDASRQVRSRNLTISAPPNFATRWLAHHLSGFSAAYPEVAIRIVSSPDHIDGPQTTASLARQSFDPRKGTNEVAIRFGNGVYPGYFVERLLVPEYVLVCSPNLLQGPSPLRTLKDLRQQVFIHDEAIQPVDKRPSWREWLRLAGVKGVDHERGPRYSNSVLVHEAVLAGQGLALVIRQQVESDVQAGRLVIPFQVTLPASYAYYLVIHETDAAKPVVKAFQEWIRTEISRHSF